MSLSTNAAAPISVVPIPTPVNPSCWRKLCNSLPSCEKIKSVIKVVLMLLAAAVLLVYNPTIFLASFVIGIMFAKHVAPHIEKISTVASAYLWITIPTIALVGFLTLHATLMVTSVLFAAYLGTETAKRTLTEPNPAPPSLPPPRPVMAAIATQTV